MIGYADPGQYFAPERTTFSVAGPESRKVKCDLCGSAGYGPVGRPPLGYFSRSWMWTHMRGHRACRFCGRILTVLMDGSQRRHSHGCPTVRPAAAVTVATIDSSYWIG